MTAVFAEAVTEMTTIKVEPDIVSIKRETDENDEKSTKEQGLTMITKVVPLG